ncbi:hypothetical protein FHW12_000348 [Dokdonella fugitiva]|uniref:Putative DnaT-like domain-containing protein n=1 Tax=Dokdonella fugitiva TaxID=328517 RepID=A0A839EPC9_9GAMM|nr:DnaT-like ssDNA-binding protein [Dokdonella fugitiva]MBA8886157.1 hypothetical protein [Dokdonella fugitiva]
MTLIVEDGTGLPNAETYVSVADADAYHLAMSNAAWAAAPTPAKEGALRRAAQYIDSFYRFRGNRLSEIAVPAPAEQQALQWPRDIVDAWPIRELVAATCELALRALSGALFADQSGGDVVSETVGPISVTYSSSGLGGQTRYAVADALLAPFTAGGARSSLRIERAS